MTLYYPGPYQLRFKSTTGPRVHIHRTNLRLNSSPPVGTAFSAIQALTRNDVVVDLDDAVDAYVLLWKPILGSDYSTIVNVELWKYEEDSFDASYVSAYDISVAGTSGSTTVFAGQLIFTYRTAGGNLLRLDYMETVSAATATLYPPYGAGNNKNLSDFVIGASNWIYARDNTYPVANLALNSGINEALWKKLYRT